MDQMTLTLSIQCRTKHTYVNYYVIYNYILCSTCLTRAVGIHSFKNVFTKNTYISVNA